MAAMLSAGAGMLPAAPLPIPSFREGIGKTHEETEFKLYPRDTQTPRTFLFALWVLARPLPINAFNSRIAQESKLLLE